MSTVLNSPRGDHAADALSRARADFFANISHEVRTPLTAVLGFTELAERSLPENASPECRDYLRAVKRNGEVLLGLVSDILELARIESGGAQAVRGPCDPRRLLGEVETLTRPRAEAKGLSLSVGAPGRLPALVRTDAAQVRHVLAHLIGNALKFTERGGVRLRLEYVPPAGGDTAGALRFEVADTGVGMAAGELTRLFQPFSRADALRKPTPPGSGAGVGLAICRRLVEQLGGTLEVRSRPGEGSTFTLTLPVGTDEAANLDDPPSAVGSVRPAPRAPNLKARVLLAEDNRDNQRVIALRLTMAGAEVAVANNGREALELARAARDAGKPFGLVVMDMQMPILDGYEATRALRNEGFDVPVIALTAHAMAEDREECLRFGCNDYATKPIDWDTLLGRLARLLDRGEPERPGHAC